MASQIREIKGLFYSLSITGANFKVPCIVIGMIQEAAMVPTFIQIKDLVIETDPCW